MNPKFDDRIPRRRAQINSELKSDADEARSETRKEGNVL